MGVVAALGVPAAAQLPGYVAPVGQELAVIGMLLCWLLALVTALWGSIREAHRYDVDRGRARASGADDGPTPGIAGFLDRWAVWSLVLLGLGLVLLAVAANGGGPSVG